MKVRLFLITVTTAILAPLLAANAQYFTDDFNTGTDGAWTHWAPAPATVSFSFPTLAPGNLGYELAAAPGTASFFTTARAGSYVTGLSIGDFVVTGDLVTWAPTNEIQMGVMARVQSPINPAGAFPACYALVYINRLTVRHSGTDQLRILRLGPSEITFLNDGLGNQGQFSATNGSFFVAGGSAAPLPGKAGYRLFFTGHGNQFIGRIMDLGTGQFMTFNDGNGNLTDFIHATDTNSTFSTGSAGFITVPNTLTPGVDTTFDNFAAAGDSLIQLYPANATNHVDTSHTVCALITAVTNPLAGAIVTFNVTNGPNATTHGTAVTDNGGIACFTYVGAGGVGTDIIDASFQDVTGARRSTFATKVWIPANQPPVAICTNVTVSAGSNCTATASIDAGSFDPEGDTLTLTQVPPGPYPLGSNAVCLVAVDSHGASNSCCGVVFVVDTTAPTIYCPTNIATTNDPGLCSAVVTFVVSAFDACGISSLSCDNPSGSVFPAGTTTVTCTAVDLAGNTNTCSFTVTVNDNEGPQVACREAPNPSAKKIPVSGKNPSSGQNPDGYYQFLAKDNCDADPLIYIHDTASSFVAGPYHSGDIFKLSQNPGGTPYAEPGTPPIVAHIHLNGDALVSATDASGNVSPNPCLAKVPPLPKLN